MKQKQTQSAHAESTNKGVNWRSKYVTQVQQQRQQQRPESPTVTLTWYAFKYKVHKLHQRYSFRMYLFLKMYLFENVPLVELMYLVFTRMPGESYRRRLRSLLLYLG